VEMSVHADVAAVVTQACLGTPAVRLPRDRDVRRHDPAGSDVHPSRCSAPDQCSHPFAVPRISAIGMRGVSVLVLFGPSAASRNAARAGLEHSVRIGALERRSRALV
jgi:hypothetical protein